MTPARKINLFLLGFVVVLATGLTIAQAWWPFDARVAVSVVSLWVCAASFIVNDFTLRYHDRIALLTSS